MESYYLIDFENVHSNGLEGCNLLGKTERVIIFWTENANNLDMTKLSKHCEASMHFEQVPKGKQSLDKHLIDYMEKLAKKHRKDCTIIIVSKDNDYNKAIAEFHKQYGSKIYKVERIKDYKPQKNSAVKAVKAVSDKPKAKNTKTQSPKPKRVNLETDIKQAVIQAGYPQSIADQVFEIVSKHNLDAYMFVYYRYELEAKNIYQSKLDDAVTDVLLYYIKKNEKKVKK